jgi:hypothetical protein
MAFYGDTIKGYKRDMLLTKDRPYPYLVGGFNHLEKYVNGKDYPIY